LIEGAFFKSEYKLAEDQTGESLLRQYATELLNQIYETMRIRIEQAIKSKVLSNVIIVRLDAHQVMYIYT
jgi:uncharacterized protein YbcI